jgi:hypothetical protein
VSTDCHRRTRRSAVPLKEERRNQHVGVEDDGHQPEARRAQAMAASTSFSVISGADLAPGSVSKDARTLLLASSHPMREATAPHCISRSAPWVSSLRSLRDRPRHRSVSTPGMVIPRGGRSRRHPAALLLAACALYLLRPLVNIELSAGLMDDGRHDPRHPYGPSPRGQDPPRPGAREPRVAASAGGPPAHRAASTPADLRPRVLRS